MKYTDLLIDHPWEYLTWSQKGQGRSAESHYTTQTIGSFRNLGRYYNQVAADDCCMWLWVPPPQLELAMLMVHGWNRRLPKARRWKYVTKGFCWVKRYRDGTPFIGMGYHTRSNSEDCLLYTIGNPTRVDMGVSQIIETWETIDINSVPGKHSEKPTEIHEQIDRLRPPGNRLEIFARERYPGWTTIGNELSGRDIRLDLADLAADRPIPELVKLQPRLIA